MSSLISIVLSLLFAGFINHVSAQTPRNPICYVCHDGGVSDITRPNTTIPLPASLNLGSSISCKQIQLAGEVFYLIPEQACQLLNFQAFRVACGCENAWNQAPRAAAVATKAPTMTKAGMNSKKTSTPSSSPSTTPSTRPTPAPVKKGKNDNMNAMKTVGIIDNDVDEITETNAPITSPIVTLSPSASSDDKILPDQVVDFTKEFIEVFRKKLEENGITWMQFLKVVLSALVDEPIDTDSLVSNVPSDTPSTVLSDVPSTAASDVPSDAPTDFFSVTPTSIELILSSIPSDVPSSAPSSIPSDVPSSAPSSIPSDVPSTTPSSIPSTVPSSIPSNVPSSVPSSIPSNVPSSVPSIVEVGGDDTSDGLTLWELLIQFLLNRPNLN